MAKTTRLALSTCLAVALAGCIAPQDSRPGMWLTGTPAPPPSDWSFTDDHREIALEVRAPYFLPHSVTIWCAALDQHFYVAARAPETKNWPGWVERRPDVRLLIGDEIYEARLALIEDSAQVARVRAAYTAKYALPDPPPEGAPPVRYWLVEPRAGR